MTSGNASLRGRLRAQRPRMARIVACVVVVCVLASGGIGGAVPAPRAARGVSDQSGALEGQRPGARSIVGERFGGTIRVSRAPVAPRRLLGRDPGGFSRALRGRASSSINPGGACGFCVLAPSGTSL